MGHSILDIEHQSVIGIFKGFLDAGEHKEIGEEILSKARKNGFHKLIIDTTNMKVLQPETISWIENEWFPKAKKQGIRYMVFIMPKDVVAKMATNRVNSYNGGIEIENVEDYPDAINWIASK